jgi:hypothetical protein
VLVTLMMTGAVDRFWQMILNLVGSGQLAETDSSHAREVDFISRVEPKARLSWSEQTLFEMFTPGLLDFSSRSIPHSEA